MISPDTSSDAYRLAVADFLNEELLRPLEVHLPMAQNLLNGQYGSLNDELLKDAVAIYEALHFIHTLVKLLPEQIQNEEHEPLTLRRTYHDIRGAASPILGYPQVMLQGIDGPLTDSQRDHIQKLHAAGLHVTYMVNYVLAYKSIYNQDFVSRLESGQNGQKTFDLPWLKYLPFRLRFLTLLRSVEVKATVPDELPSIYGDFITTREILQFMVENAVRFTPEGILVFDVQSQANRLHIRLESSGNLPGQNVDDILEPDEDEHKAATLRQMAEKQGGNLSLEHPVEGGFVLMCELPIADKA